MVKQTIQIFARIKPTKGKTGIYEVEKEENVPIVSFAIPKEATDGYINNKKEVHKFRFEKIFAQNTKQDEVFELVGKPVIDNVLAGYNGTIFAYGQTGSGKTFTITGGAERYIDRGIIPRALTYIFENFSKSSEYENTAHVSYLEIYNENGYDLLDPKHEASKLEDLPKVFLMEDQDQNIHLRNLTTHPAATEEDALNLLFLGDTNRMIAETPMNQASTRSHCIFTIHLTSREHGSATIRRSKLHLVDLAGSERVGKTGVNGVLLQEAKYINLSLHFLEQVIVSLSDKNRQHIPYRNSMMTSVLRDSLGGNCMTTMIATLSVDKRNIDESISTCRFAQRVALIKNDAILNEELDPRLLIVRLKKEIASLRDELLMATGEQRTDSLTEEDLERCHDAVKFYLEDSDPDALVNIGTDMRKIQQCFRLMKKELQESKSTSSSREEINGSEQVAMPTEFTHYDNQETKRLKDLLMQRDNEINILVNMLKKEKKRTSEAISSMQTSGYKFVSESKSSHTPSELTSSTSLADTKRRSRSGGNNNVSNHNKSGSRSSSGETASPEKQSKNLKCKNEERTKLQILGNMSVGRQEAFEIFRRDYRENNGIDQNKLLLKQRYSEAKSLGEVINGAKSKINKLKSSIEQHRLQRVMQGLVDPGNAEPDEMEIDMKNRMENEKHLYKENYERLKALKTEIEHLQHLLEKAKVKLMKDFELWWAEQTTAVQEQENPRDAPISAWKSPSMTPQTPVRSTLSAEPSQSSLSSEPSSQSYFVQSNQAAMKRNVLPGVRSTDNKGHSSHSSLSSQQSHSHSRQTPEPPSSIAMTGDPQADADIMAFIKARQNVIKHAHTSGP